MATRPLIQESEQLKHVMVLKVDQPDKLVFQFQAGKWALATLFMALGLVTLTFFMWRELGNSFWLLPFLGFALLLFYSTVFSLTATRMLEIDPVNRRVRYLERTLYKKEGWEKPFDLFQSVRIYHPRQFGEARRQVLNLVIELVLDEDRFFRIGYHEFGAIREASAEQLGRRLAQMMDLRLEEPSANEIQTLN